MPVLNISGRNEMEPSEAVKALYENILKRKKAGAESFEMTNNSRIWKICELDNGIFVGLSDQSAKRVDYLLGYCSVTCAFWWHKPCEDDLLSASFEVKAKGFGTGVWGYGAGQQLNETVKMFFSGYDGIPANSRLANIIEEAMAFLFTIKIEERSYTEHTIAPDRDYSEPSG